MLRKVMKKIQNRKDKGSIIDDILPLLLATIAMGIFIVFFANFMVNIDKKNDVDQVARKYILQMETTGYLTAADESALLEELKSLGVSSIDLTGTTRSEVGYGQTITLCIKGNLAVKSMDMSLAFDFLESDSTIGINIKKVSTAKH